MLIQEVTPGEWEAARERASHKDRVDESALAQRFRETYANTHTLLLPAAAKAEMDADMKNALLFFTSAICLCAAP